MISESCLERVFCAKVKSAGGKAIKMETWGRAGLPDRLVLMPGGRVYFVELKRENGVLSEVQKYVIKEFAKLDFNVRIIRNAEQIEEFIKEVSSDEVRAAQLSELRDATDP